MSNPLNNWLRRNHHTWPVSKARAAYRIIKSNRLVGGRVSRFRSAVLNQPHCQIIHTEQELHEWLARADKAGQISDDAFRKTLGQFHYEPPPQKIRGIDPFSEAYREIQLELYETLAGKPYEQKFEAHSFDVEWAMKYYWPYVSKNHNTAGRHLLAIGFLLDHLQLPAAADILDMGPGWGNTSLILARLGYNVTALDIEDNYLELIRRRAQQADVRIDTRLGNFLSIENLDKKFDLILFFESFHHELEHEKLLRLAVQKLKPGGQIVFAGEPILPAHEFGKRPWGIRNDSLSIWSIRSMGWLELGFSEPYFFELLKRVGLEYQKFTCPAYPEATTYRTVPSSSPPT